MKPEQHNNLISVLSSLSNTLASGCPLLHLNKHVMTHSLPSSHCFCLAERGQGDEHQCRITEPSKRPSNVHPYPELLHPS